MTQDNNPKYVIVPKEPTDEMVDAHVHCDRGKTLGNVASNGYAAMLAASPQSHGLVMVGREDVVWLINRLCPPGSMAGDGSMRVVRRLRASLEGE